ncbi:MAG: membrane dipeptidase [Bacteroidetes bacterium]|nr:membrane dipeptidase [Bacteroidota bacterium]
MPFFDFHIHPTLKTVFSENANGKEKFSPWERLKEKDIPFMLRWCSEFQRILASQANLSQMIVNDYRLICLAFYMPERSLIDNKLISSAAKGKMGRYLNPAKLSKLMTGNPFDRLTTEEWNSIVDATAFGVTDRKLKPLLSRADYDEQDDKTIHAVFSVEGCHTLCNAVGSYNEADILNNIDRLRSMVSLMSVNLTHMEQSPVCNHAFGVLFVDNDVFIPTGEGIGSIGVAVIKHCYTNGIMIDVKHMSLGARKQLYNLRQTVGFNGINQPIVCTHAGFTGISWNEIPQYILNYKWSRGADHVLLQQGKAIKYGGKYLLPAFNTSSINLYDEDILAILRSGGMIGLSLDKRILGYQAFDEKSEYHYPAEPEYISLAEEKHFLFGGTVGEAFNDGRCMNWQQVEEAGETALESYHLRYFMAHILHVITVARNGGYDESAALKQLCIGSDFDGLINPVDCCETIDEIYYIKQQLEDSLVGFAEESDMELPAGFDVKKFSDGLFFTNGRDYVLGRLRS